MKNQAKLVQKWYVIVTLRILTAKIDLEKAKEAKEKIVMQNASIYTKVKIESIFWLSTPKKISKLLY